MHSEKFDDFEIGRQLVTNGAVTDWASVGIAAFGGAISGAVARINISNYALLNYIGIFATGSFWCVCGWSDHR